MGKMLSGMIAVIFMAGGLTALTIGGAAADPYPGTINTRCHADNLNNPRVGNPARVKFRAGTGGNGAPRGDVYFRYERVSSGRIEAQYRKSYVGTGWDRYSFSGLPRGKYVVRVRFDSRGENSVYQNCRTSFRQTVRPRR